MDINIFVNEKRLDFMQIHDYRTLTHHYFSNTFYVALLVY